MIKCDISVVSILDEETLLIDIESEKEFELKDYEQLVIAAAELGEGKKWYNLIQVGNNTIPNHFARVASTSQSGSIYKKADAFVIHSSAQKIIANFYLNFHKPFVPTRFFNSTAQAKSWLDSLKVGILSN